VPAKVVGKGTILVVEDDESVRRLACAILKRSGYQVLEAENGGEALLACEAHRGVIDLLLTDVVMPRLDGPRVASRLQQLRPDMRVLFMSGYPDGSFGATRALPAGTAILQKPLRPDTLLAKVREVLSADAPPVVPEG
jgi:CheY-like chemotaxis protein